MKRKIDKSKLEACKLVWKKRNCRRKGYFGKIAQKKLCKAV